MTVHTPGWTCMMHGRKDDHWCVQCSMCHKDLKEDELFVDILDNQWDVCIPCGMADPGLIPKPEGKAPDA